MGFYDGIDQEEAASDLGAFMRAGHYLAMVTRIRSGLSKKQACDYVAIDMRILKIFPDGATPKIVKEGCGPKDWIDDPKGLHYVGEEVSAQFLSKWASAKRNYKAILANAVGVEEAQITPAFCAQIEKDELLSGHVLEMNNRIVEKKDGGPFTKIWAVRALDDAEIAQSLDAEIVKQYLSPDTTS